MIPVLDAREQAILNDIKDKPDDWPLKITLHMISQQRNEREQINGFFASYSKPIYELVEMTSKRMTKLEDAQQESSKALVEIVSEVKHMVKCVDAAIVESKEDKAHYYKQYEKTNESMSNLDKRLSVQEANAKTKWGMLCAVATITGTAIIAFIFSVFKSGPPTA
jgi:antirestriction protein ArdC